MSVLGGYYEATRAMEAAQAEVKRLGDVRAVELARINAAGMSYGKIAAQVGTSRKNVQKLVERGRELMGDGGVTPTSPNSEEGRASSSAGAPAETAILRGALPCPPTPPS